LIDFTNDWLSFEKWLEARLSAACEADSSFDDVISDLDT
jgi:hypothetical protein